MSDEGPADLPPTEEARRRAERAGIDLDALRRDDPAAYRMLNAEPVLHVAPALQGAAGEALFAVSPGTDLFAVPATAAVRLLAFPPPDADTLAAFDRALAGLVERPEMRERHAVYREVSDRRGARRELLLPLPPGAWDGGEGMVGPFADEAAADAFGRDRVMGRGLATYDVVAYGAAWFCDVFEAGGL